MFIINRLAVGTEHRNEQVCQRFAVRSDVLRTVRCAESVASQQVPSCLVYLHVLMECEAAQAFGVAIEILTVFLLMVFSSTCPILILCVANYVIRLVHFLSPKYTWLFTSSGKFSPPISHFAASVSFILKSGQVRRKEASTTDFICAGVVLKSL